MKPPLPRASEAADIDGDGATQKFRYITFTNLAPAMTISVLFLLLASLKVFDLPFSLTEGGPGYATTMVTQSIISEGVGSSRIGFASAMSTCFWRDCAGDLFSSRRYGQTRRETGVKKKYTPVTLFVELIMLAVCIVFARFIISSSAHSRQSRKLSKRRWLCQPA